MNKLVVGIILAVLSVCVAEHYTDQYDDINIQEILENRRLLGSYVKCILDQGRCTPEGKELKIHIKDAMQSACEKCTQKQRTAARTIVKHIREKETEYWEQVKSKYDPKDEYKKIYEPFLAGTD